MIKTAFRIATKNYQIPVFRHPMLDEALVEKALQSNKFKSYVGRI